MSWLAGRFPACGMVWLTDGWLDWLLVGGWVGWPTCGWIGWLVGGWAG